MCVSFLVIVFLRIDPAIYFWRSHMHFTDIARLPT
jgi:hypothetical protein